jgi:hypothetical protein
MGKDLFGPPQHPRMRWLKARGTLYHLCANTAFITGAISLLPYYALEADDEKKNQVLGERGK